MMKKRKRKNNNIKINKQLSRNTAYAIVETIKEMKQDFVVCTETSNDDLDVLNFKRKEIYRKKPSLGYFIYKHIHKNGFLFNFSFVLLLLLIVLTVKSLFNLDLYATETLDLNINKEKIVEDTSNLTVDLSNVTTGNYVWDKETKGKIKKYLNNLSYIDIEQTNVTTTKNSTVYSTKLITNLSCDFTNIRLKGSTIFEDTLGNSYNGFFYDRNTNLYLDKSAELSEWKRSTDTTLTVNFSIRDYANVTEFYNMLLGDFPIAENTKGILREDYLTFENTRMATSSDITSLNYDKLGYVKNTIIFKEEQTGLKPLSMIKEVTFDKDGTTYSSKLVIIVKSLSNKELSIPKFVEIQNNSTISLKEEDSLAISDDIDLDSESSQREEEN